MVAEYDYVAEMDRKDREIERLREKNERYRNHFEWGDNALTTEIERLRAALTEAMHCTSPNCPGKDCYGCECRCHSWRAALTQEDE